MLTATKSQFKACIFDLDGTLLNTLPTIHHYANRSLTHFGLRSVTFQDCKALCRLSISQFYHKLLLLGGCPEEAVDALKPLIRDYDLKIYLQDFTYLTEPYDDVIDTMRTLKSRNILIGVLSNKPDKLAQALISIFFDGLVDICIGQTPDSVSKPDAKSMDKIKQGLSLQKDEIVYVGDTDVDMQTAINAEVFSVAVTWGYQPCESLMPFCPNFIAEKPTDLLKLF